MKRSYFQSTITDFLDTNENEILGELAKGHSPALEHLQRNAWISQIRHLKSVLGQPNPIDGYVLFEYAIPQMGKRADVVLLIEGTVFVLEYKVGEDSYQRNALDQALDYALDLKNFHEGSHGVPIVPILVATRAPDAPFEVQWTSDGVAKPIRANAATLRAAIQAGNDFPRAEVDAEAWLRSGYKPTPTIIEAAKALYKGHRVEEISRSDAGAINLSLTTRAIVEAIEHAKTNRTKTICFITGVPGSGKTLAGLNLATERMRAHDDEHAVFLSGNGPLVDILREALARDDVERSKEEQRPIKKSQATSKARAFVQNIHHFRDESLRREEAPAEKVVVFDEAQRAWTMEEASKFMRNKRQIADFAQSEPHFLLSVMDRHDDWCCVICIVGGGQEINRGEAGLPEWFAALREDYTHWRVLYSDRIEGHEYQRGYELSEMLRGLRAEPRSDLHLAVNVRSFRAEKVAAWVKAVIDGDADQARAHSQHLARYPIVLTRNLDQARAWLKMQARGTERYGLVASSDAVRLKPYGIFVKSKINAVNWFLNSKDDVRSSYALEDVATEFDVQGLELDWVGVCWDANYRFTEQRWAHHRFSGAKWLRVKDEFRRMYLANSYRVLLTRARQGLVIFVPEGSVQDPTRPREFYDGTYEFLRECGAVALDDSL
jgi:hypothetical protein